MSTPTPSDGATPMGETPAVPAVSGASTLAPISMTREEFNRQLEEERKKGERTARDSDEVKTLRAAKKRLDELEAASKTDLDKATERATAAEALAAENATKYRSALIRSSFTTAAITANIPADRVDAALKLADMTGVDVGDDGTVSGMDKAIKSLPDWLAATVVDTTKQGSGIPSTPKPDNGTHAMTEAEEARRQALAARQVHSRF